MPQPIPLDALNGDPRVRETPGPVALIIVEDAAAVPETVAHHLERGVPLLVLALPDGLVVETEDPRVLCVRTRTRGPGAAERIVNTLLPALMPGTWLYYGFNAEFLIHPFAETRRLSEMLAFHASERRASMPTVLVDLYARDLDTHPDGVDLASPAFDVTAHFAKAEGDGIAEPPRTAIHGGLRWRMDDLIPKAERRLDRYALVRARADLRLLPGHLWSDPELNTLSCPWHRNLTACIASFRAAKALATNPGPSRQISGFDWSGAAAFDWTSRQLLEAGFMETGQWF